MYLIIEGAWGSGKTTQAKKLVEYIKKTYPNKEVVYTREPGGSEIAEAIRKLVQGTKFNDKMEAVCDAYLYAAARAESLRKVVLPVIRRNGIVISDRSFITSLAIQGVGQGFGIDKVLEINKAAIEGVNFDFVFYLDIDIKTAKDRTFDSDGDKFENETMDFATQTIDGYHKISKLDMFSNKWINVDAKGEIDEVFEKVKTAFDNYCLPL